MRTRLLMGCTSAFMLLFLTASQLLAATLTVAPSGSGKYLLQGGSFTGVAALDVTVNYDTATLSAPQIAKRELAGPLFVANPNIPGQVRLAFIADAGVSGSGAIAEITFTVKGGSPPLPTVGAASLYDVNSVSIPVTAGSSTVPPSSGSPVVQPVPREPIWTGGTGDAGSKPQTGSTATTGSGTPTWLGTVTMPGDAQKTAETKAPQVDEPPPPPQPAAAAGHELEAAIPTSTAPQPPPRERFKLPVAPASIVDRFRTYTGELTVAALKPLFTQRGGTWATQQPEIAPADGKTKVSVLINLERAGLEAPNFALRGLEMSSLRTVGETGWQIEATPAKDKTKASITMLVEDATAEIPVTVVPPLPAPWAGKKLTEAEVNRYLLDRGTAKAPAGDLNRDGRRDYLDDYIMIGNFLMSAANDQSRPAAAPKNSSSTGDAPKAPARP